jgi:hypothetical protein
MRVFVVFASRQDASARSLIEWWSPRASLLTCDDLSVPGWRHTSNGQTGDMAVIGGRFVAEEEIEGALIRWPGVFGWELQHILAGDRQYVAAEMTAFLCAWLAGLQRPVLNRPSAASLIGPSWRPEKWVQVAAALGIPVRPLRRHIVFPGEPTPPLGAEVHATVTVLGGRCFGEADSTLRVQSQKLAATAGVSLLDVLWSRPEAEAELISADLLPRLDTEEKAAAVLDLLRNGPSGERP